jgi:hypothetical protein
VIFAIGQIVTQREFSQDGLSYPFAFVAWEQLESFDLQSEGKVAVVTLTRRPRRLWGSRIKLIFPVGQIDLVRALLTERLPER